MHGTDQSDVVEPRRAIPVRTRAYYTIYEVRGAGGRPVRQPLADLADPRVADLAVHIQGQRWGRVSALYGMLLHQPAVAEGWAGLGSAIRRRTSLDDRLRELAICLVARVCDQSYEWDNHAPLARAAGASDEELDALLDRARCSSFNQRERVALDLVEATARDEVSDAGLARAAAEFSPSELVELVATAAYYVGTARFLSAFGITAGAPSLLDPRTRPDDLTQEDRS